MSNRPSVRVPNRPLHVVLDVPAIQTGECDDVEWFEDWWSSEHPPRLPERSGSAFLERKATRAGSVEPTRSITAASISNRVMTGRT
jgi:hypothetical protein